jgi:hypothetical protein
MESIGACRMENEKKINWEKIGAYVAIIIILCSFWQIMFGFSDGIGNMKERIAKLEVKVEHLEAKK